jgi:hypothetical protein
VSEQYANNPVEADHGRLKARLRPMRRLKRLRAAGLIAGGHAFVQNLRRGHYELAIDVPHLFAFGSLHRARRRRLNGASTPPTVVRPGRTQQRLPSCPAPCGVLLKKP